MTTTKRAARKLHREEFQAAIARFRHSSLKRDFSGIEFFSKTVSSAAIESSRGIFCRVRPLSQVESEEKYEFEAITHHNSGLFLHKCSIGPDLSRRDAERFAERKWLRHYHFDCFEKVFGPLDDNETVFNTLVKQRHILHDWTLLMFGQTGSGKSYSFNGILSGIITDIVHIQTFRIGFMQVFGTQLSDLSTNRKLSMYESGLHKEIFFHDNFRTREEIYTCIETVLKTRKTRSTYINSTSSRSHLFVVMEHGQRRTTLVDLAGSERNEDTIFHDPIQIRESQAINASLSVLKQCLRYKYKSDNAAMVMPYRESLLTRVLKNALNGILGKDLAVLFTVSPGSSDTEHALNTLSYALNLATGMDNTQPACFCEDLGTQRFQFSASLTSDDIQEITVLPIKWNESQVIDWLSRTNTGIKLPSGTDGKSLVRMSEKRWIQLCGEMEGKRVFKSLKEEIARVRSTLEARRCERVQESMSIRSNKFNG